MSDALRKVQAGQPLAIPASAYNAFVDAALDHRHRASRVGREARPAFRQASIVLVRNDSGADRERFDVLGVGVPVIDPADGADAFKERVALAGVVPVTGTHEGLFVVLAEPLASGAIGHAFAAGVCPARIDVPDGEGEWRCAEIAGGAMANLVAHPQGSASILWRAGGTGVQWAVVRLGNASSMHVFPVELSQVGGDEGGESAPASWTYDVRGVESGALLAEDINPVAAPHQWRRPVTGAMEAATFGYAHFQDDGAGGRELVLGWINEAPAGEGDDPGSGDDVPPPCGHPGNEPGAGGESDGGDDTEHPGDDPGAGGNSSGDDTDHPGDSPSPPSSGDCE